MEETFRLEVCLVREELEQKDVMINVSFWSPCGDRGAGLPCRDV